MHLGNRYSSLTRIVLQNIRDNKKICANNYSDTVLCILKGFVLSVLGHFPKTSCVKHLLVTKASFLRKWSSTLVLGIFSISETNRIKDGTHTVSHNSLLETY